MQKICFLLLFVLAFVSGQAQAPAEVKLRKKDYKRDVELVTDSGTMVIRLSDATPLHRDNFLKLVKSGYYDGVLFHRVINQFMIQAGDPDSKGAPAGKPLGNGGPGYTVPAEFRPALFHRKGVIAAAREGDQVNPSKASSGSQFYIVQGKKFTDGAMDTLERRRNITIPADQREVYKIIGGTPHLDQQYTVFGQLIRGEDVLDRIAATPTSKAADRDRPLQDIRIVKARLVKRKRI
ncbi:peptidylprolyl isomerase [Nostoc ellipsosporum NOK]|nr:peptidylprolyl isomerase [Nostoc ellipsosporum NOK]